MDKYWIVQSYGEKGHRYGQPYFRHGTKDEAVREAKRLANKVQRRFVVLETVACFEPPAMEAAEVPLS